MRPKLNAALAYFAQLIQAENLESARIGKNAAFPRHESVQPAHLADGFVSRPQIEVIGVAEENLYAEFFENVLRYALDRAQRSDGHKDGSLDFTVGCEDSAQAGGTVSGSYGENACCHSETLLLRGAIPIVTLAL
jgi:hypothetical protein